MNRIRRIYPKPNSFIAALTIAVASLLLSCASTRPPTPTSSYQAVVEVSIQASGESEISFPLVEKYHDRKRRRATQVAGESVVVIDRPDLGVTWILDPKTRTFDEVRIVERSRVLPELADPFARVVGGKFVLIGPDLVGNVEALKYYVQTDEFSGYAWLRTDHIPLRFSGTRSGPDSQKRSKVEIVYSEIRTGRQPAHEFSIPQNYAGYDERRKQRGGASNSSRDDIDRMTERLRDQQMQTRPPGTY